MIYKFGTEEIIVTERSTDHPAVDNDNILISGTAYIVITLPANPVKMSRIRIFCSESGNNFKIDGNGHNIGDLTTKTYKRAPTSYFIELIYVDTLTKWIISDPYSSCVFSQIVAGGYFSLGIRADGSGWSWGQNTDGQLGDNTKTNRSSPVSVLGGISFSKISSGSTHSNGINGADGSGWAWGYNNNGRLGDNTITNRSSPVSIAGGISFSQLGNGHSNTHSLAIKGLDGSGWAWGYNGYGQVGNNTVTDQSSPVSVLGGISFSQITCGGNFSLGINGTDGSCWSWGYNSVGQLGDNTTTNRSSPVSVVGGISFSQISAGNWTSVGINGVDGSGWAWGRGMNGNLGNNSTSDVSSPVSVLGGMSFSKISAGYQFVLAINGTNGTGWSWGGNDYGQLGDNSKTNRSSPVSVAGGISFSNQVGTGGYHSLTIRGVDNSLWVWGYNTSGQLGDNTITSKSSPV